MFYIKNISFVVSCSLVVECCFDVLAQLIVHICTLTGSHKLFLRIVSQVTNSVCDHDLVGVSPVLLLESFTENLNNLVHSGLSIISEQNLGFLEHHLANELELQLSLLNIVSNGQKTDPV